MALDDTWFARDLPTLEACVAGVDAAPGTGIRIHEIASQTGLTVDDAYVSVRALESAGLVECRWVNPATHGRVVRGAGQARSLVGSWPSPETAADRLIAVIDQRIADSPEGSEQRTRWQKLRDGTASIGRDVLVEVVAQAMTGRLPGL